MGAKKGVPGHNRGDHCRNRRKKIEMWFDITNNRIKHIEIHAFSIFETFHVVI